MKKSIFNFLIASSLTFTIVFSTYAQTEKTEESTSFNTLFNRIDDFSGFGSFMMNFGSNKGDGYVLSGGGGAVLFNKTYYVGGFGIKGSLNTFTPADEAIPFDINYSGFWLGYIYNKDMLVHPVGSLKLGWGNINVTNGSATDNIFVVVPQIGAELNFTKWIKMELGISYQLVSGINLIEIEPSQFRNLHIGLDFKFGWFK